MYAVVAFTKEGWNYVWYFATKDKAIEFKAKRAIESPQLTFMSILQEID